MTRWCEGPCGRELELLEANFPLTGPEHYLSRVCRWCQAARKRHHRRLPTVKARYARKRRARMKDPARRAARRKWARAYYLANYERIRAQQADYFQRVGSAAQRVRRSSQRKAAA